MKEILTNNLICCHLYMILTGYALPGHHAGNNSIYYKAIGHKTGLYEFWVMDSSEWADIFRMLMVFFIYYAFNAG